MPRTCSRRTCRQPWFVSVDASRYGTDNVKSTHYFPERLITVLLQGSPLRLQPPRDVPRVTEEERATLQVRPDKSKEVRLDSVRGRLDRDVWV